VVNRLINYLTEYTVSEHLYCEMMHLARKDYYKRYALGGDELEAIEKASDSVIWDDDSVELVLKHASKTAKEGVNEIMPEGEFPDSVRAVGLFRVDLALVLDKEESSNE
jgi:hypothetical protein